MIIIRIKQIIFILRKKQVIILATDLSNNKTNPKENVLSNSDSSSAVKESVLYQLIYNDNFHLTEDIFFGAGFNKFKSAIIVKYLTFNKFDDYTSLDALRCNLRKLFPDFSVDSILEVPNTILFLITTEKSEKDFFFSEILTLLYNHLEQITKKNKIPPATMGISKPLDSISSINSVLKSTADVFKNTAKIMPCEIRFFDEYEDTAVEGPSYDIYNIKQNLSDIIDSADGLKAIDSFLEKYHPLSMNYNKTSVNFFCFSTMAGMQFLMTEQNIKFSNQFESLDVLWTKLNGFETIEKTFEWLKEILIVYYEQMLRSKRKDKNDIVSRIRSYIDENYQTITSVEQIAAILFISCGYAKNMFKKHTGQTIYDYLVETRISRAKKLLSNSSIKVYEVSELVGYMSKAHFTEVFKKKTGMTPKEYQLKASHEKKRWDNKSEIFRTYFYNK